MFDSIIDSSVSFDFSGAMICTLCSLILGIIIALAYKIQDKASKNFLVSLTVMPVIVQIVIMLVNGNLGAGVAIMGAFSLIRYRSAPGSEKQLKVTIPENLDYSGIFDDIFDKYTLANSLEKVKTVNLGSMYELVYRITEKDEKQEKQMLDEIRCRNGNLTVICGRVPVNSESL